MTMNHWYQSMYQMFELVSDFIEAWLCYGFVGLFLPDRVLSLIHILWPRYRLPHTRTLSYAFLLRYNLPGYSFPRSSPPGNSSL